MAWFKGSKVLSLRQIQKKVPNRIQCQRIFKCVVNVTISLILCLNPTTVASLGGEPAMLPLMAVVSHPGRRFGTMIETVLLCASGNLLGNAYAALARFCAKKALGTEWDLSDKLLLLENYNGYRAALGILAVFEIFMLFFHGWMRSVSHKFFSFVFQMFLVVHFAFSSNLRVSALKMFQNFSIPFFVGMGLSLASNLLLFPEFGSSYLGRSMIYTLNGLHNTLDSTVQFFVSFDGEDELSYTTQPLTLAQMVKKKAELRTKLNATKAVLHECLYEISYSYNSPHQLKATIEILGTELAYVNGLINASQLKFKTLLGAQGKRPSALLNQVLKRTKGPIYSLEKTISQKLLLIKHAIAYSYDVKMTDITGSPNTFLKPIDLDLIDFHLEIDDFANAMATFDITFREELSNLSSEYGSYLSPNDDIFLLSSFLINLRETANSICNLLKEAHVIFEYRKGREAKGVFGRKLWVIFLSSAESVKNYINFSRNGLVSGAETASLNGTFVQPNAFIDDQTRHLHVTAAPKSLDGSIDISKKQPPVTDRLLTACSNFYKKYKAHFRFGFQITVGLMLSSFPMFVPESRAWFNEYRGTWIAFVCILVLEPEVGSTFFVFFLRGIGVITGSAWGYLSYVAAINQTKPSLEVFVTAIGAIPGFYYFICTPYVKAAIIGIISIYIVLLSTVLPSEVGGSIAANFGKRCLAMLYGGLVALICQLVFFPIKARDELVREVAFSTGALSKLTLLYASGLDGEHIKFSLSEDRFKAFKELSTCIKGSLTRADAFRKTAKKEPRLKGKFDDIGQIFYEIIFILREILDRIDNIVYLRRVYGSAIIEEFNSSVYPYRRQLSAALSNSFKTVQLALLTKAPLPHYLPSSKAAHIRLLEKVREVVDEKYHQNISDSETDDSASEIVMSFTKKYRSSHPHQQEYLLKAKFLSWNATSSATEEVIDYIEELLELTKLLVGVHEFKYGFLSRALYSEYAAKATRRFHDLAETQGPIDRNVLDEGDTDPQVEEQSDDETQDYNEEFNPIGITGDHDAHSRASDISNGFRRRVQSIGSWINSGDLTSAKSIGEYSSGEFDSEDLEDEVDMPLSLMRVISKRNRDSLDD